ncbi:ligase-associated DNA damage response endonuclease PdeM [Luteolibacter marinus]|uniref:ligase-associated DNA damage response endonuclease PdeM n=1 Tax=Luteolibacter marinus TaxID=2776705 RepID=UPI001869403F|nr:ligase-associated DNA damage response endonuclease PdeM [Luteolibacter marinus]
MTTALLEQTIELLPEKAVLLADRTLVVADLHLGKAIAFQAKGLAIPEGDSDSDLASLATLCQQQNASRLIIDGDLFHSPAGLTTAIEQSLESFMEKLGIPVQLVIGNHDRKIARLPAKLEPVPSIEAAGFHIVHDPGEARDDRPTIAAHWHPVARIADGKRTSLRLPCFLIRGEMLVLPSFGSFTGGAIVEPRKDDRIFVAPGDQVIEVPPRLLRK